MFVIDDDGRFLQGRISLRNFVRLYGPAIFATCLIAVTGIGLPILHTEDALHGVDEDVFGLKRMRHIFIAEKTVEISYGLTTYVVVKKHDGVLMTDERRAFMRPPAAYVKLRPPTPYEITTWEKHFGAT